MISNEILWNPENMDSITELPNSYKYSKILSFRQNGFHFLTNSSKSNLINSQTLPLKQFGVKSSSAIEKSII